MSPKRTPLQTGRRDRLRRGIAGLLGAWRRRLHPSGDEAPGSAPNVTAKAEVPQDLRAPVDETLHADEVSIEAFAVLQQQARGLDIAFVDVRTVAEQASGMVPEAHTCPPEAVAELVAALQEHEVVVFVCASGVRSSAAALVARDAGLHTAWSLSGGMGAWRREGGEVVRG